MRLILPLFILAGAATQIQAANFDLCPNQAAQGGFGGTFTAVASSSDVTCGASSGVTLGLTDSTNYAKLTWTAANSGYPSDLTLGNLGGLSANVQFQADSTDLPYFEAAFHDVTGALGADNSTDEILIIQYGVAGLSPTSLSAMTFDPGSSLVHIYDNTAGHNLLGTGTTPTTLDNFLSTYGADANQSIENIRLAIGLAGGCASGGCSETLRVDSMSLDQTPEPGTIALMLSGIGGFALYRRRKV